VDFLMASGALDVDSVSPNLNQTHPGDDFIALPHEPRSGG
jgi:hypothetical protein